MGQAASKAAEAARRTGPRASQAAHAQRTRAAAEAEWKRTSGAGGGHSARAADVGGEGGVADDAAEKMPEMPPDLIKFLNDAGPLKRTVDKERTSPKVYDTLVTDEAARVEQEKQANKRVRRRMPILSSHGDASGEEHDGSTTERTTNFSTRKRSEPARLGLTREELFRLANDLKGVEVDSSKWRKAVEREYGRIVRNNMIGSKNFNQLQERVLFENSLRYISVPVLMQDSEDDIIGVWQRTADDIKYSTGMKMVPEGSLQFTILGQGNGDNNGDGNCTTDGVNDSTNHGASDGANNGAINNTKIRSGEG